MWVGWKVNRDGAGGKRTEERGGTRKRGQKRRGEGKSGGVKSGGEDREAGKERPEDCAEQGSGKGEGGRKERRGKDLMQHSYQLPHSSGAGPSLRNNS